MKDELLIIFAKNPILGKVKTRLAATMGDEKALAIYHILLTHTIKITSELNCDKAIFYSEFIDDEDKWDNAIYKKYLQEGDDLGKRMEKAFSLAFKNGYKKVCIIGTDCLEITDETIENGFSALGSYDVVIGPAHDGGYYLLGLKETNIALFKNKQWSTSSVLSATIFDFKKLKLAYDSLPVLSDIDDEKDWINSKDLE